MKSIIRHHLYIKHIISAMESHLSKCFIPMDRPRKSDCFCFTLSGSCRYALDDGRVFAAEAGDIIFLPKGQDYSMNVLSDSYDYIVCNFIFADKGPKAGEFFSAKNPIVFEKEFRKLAQLFSIQGADWWLSCMTQLYKIYTMLSAQQHTDYMPGSAKANMIHARTWIRTHLSDPDLSVSFLATQCNMSTVHFRKLFKNVYHSTPAKYINQERIAYAKQLMELKELQLEDIAQQCGFSYLPYFYKVFKATTGITPAAFRKTLQ